MLFKLYLLSILYTNTMGWIIISKCNPIINKIIESKGYKLIDKDDTDYVVGVLVSVLKFLIPVYYLNEALKLSGKNFDIERLIEEKLDKGEIEQSFFNETNKKMDDSIFRDERKEALSKGSYSKPITYKANPSMYTKDRYPNRDGVDIAFWEEDPKIRTYVQVEEVVKPVAEPLSFEKYVSTASEEELEELLKRLKKLDKAA